MRFTTQLVPDEAQLRAYLGYGDASPDQTTQAAMRKAGESVSAAATPRWCAKPYGLTGAEQGQALALAGGVPLPGDNIAAHLKGCEACLLLSVTLGAGVDALLRTAGAGDMREAVLLDTAASVLVEQYADAAEALAVAHYAGDTPYATPRFSPGYGDLPLALQHDLARLLDTGRAIGLTVSESGILLPRKSVTALIGLARRPVTGRLAGCESCALAPGCPRDKPCASPVHNKATEE